MEKIKLIKLSDGNVGENYFVKEINLDIKIKRRLEILGMTSNSEIMVLNKKKTGAMIVRVRGTRFALGRLFADGIIVGGEGE